jgi:hypothetical protein
MNHVSLCLDPSDLLNPRPSFRHRASSGAVQINFESSPRGPLSLFGYFTAADAREVAAAFVHLAAEIEIDDVRLAAEEQAACAATPSEIPAGVTVIDVTGNIDTQLRQAGVS